MASDVIIIGAGLSGLACARTLQEADIAFTLLEASDGPGGRVRTDRHEGFLLDRGFQVYLDAYPTARQMLDLPALDLRPFEPGALIFTSRKMHRMMDVFRRPSEFPSSAFAPVGSVGDKLRVALLKWRSRRSSLEDMFKRPDRSTETALREFGFSEGMIDIFFRSFYGGIFLERELRTSSRMFDFTFAMFSDGSATLPAKGMQEIPDQLAASLPEGSLKLNTEVVNLSPGEVTLASGEVLRSDRIVMATDAATSARLLPDQKAEPIGWRSVTNLYFACHESPIGEPIIALNGTGKGLVNNVCVLSDVSPGYAPEGQHLVSVSLLGLPENPDLPEAVKTELNSWFGPEVDEWRHLRTDRIPHALPEQLPNAPTLPTHRGGFYFCGDHTCTASIEGAIASGQTVAKQLIAGQG